MYTFRLSSVLVLLLGMIALASAAQIIPVHIDTPGGFGPGHALPPGCTLANRPSCNLPTQCPWERAIQCPIDVPDGTIEIAGWESYMVDLAVGPLNYMTAEI